MSETPSVVSSGDAARIAELEREVERLGHEVRFAERVRLDLKAWAMRLGYRDSDTHALDYLTFIHAKTYNKATALEPKQ